MTVTSTSTSQPTPSDSTPAVGSIDFGSLQRTEPVGRLFGFDRGRCIDRYYIEAFLARHAYDIRGRVLEVADNEYTTRFGKERVSRSEVLHAVPGNQKATLVADLTDRDGFPAAAFDCVVLTQTLQHIYDLHAAIDTIHHTLAPGGVLLATVPGISQISRYDMDRWGDYWRFTSLTMQRLMGERFPKDKLTIAAFGNVLAATAFLHGLAIEDLDKTELDHHDRDYELLITVRARKPEGS